MKINGNIVNCIRKIEVSKDNNECALTVLAMICSDILKLLNNQSTNIFIEHNNKIYLCSVLSIYYVPCKKGLLQIVFNVKEEK